MSSHSYLPHQKLGRSEERWRAAIVPLTAFETRWKIRCDNYYGLEHSLHFWLFWFVAQRVRWRRNFSIFRRSSRRIRSLFETTQKIGRQNYGPAYRDTTVIPQHGPAAYQAPES
jgi:hypothetical protein